ncbi:osmosensor SHO1 SCDLUD_000146 [Saccharomycodes ludwigii]|uniref:osmosensor SHO1 n=1 Tax=Saccharomycodes ludwigii TaxID=36035 RepID=UPI001E899F5D|nr:hypothetical protein SCDLUD_000146 [Saccharomycodes ludwigii]KAH3902566.1 hypothetical protein SCDLUD_000146 [Saccharomycodes ludwigii]
MRSDPRKFFTTRNEKRRGTNIYVKHDFNISRLLGDPFAVSSLSIALISWIIALVGSITSAAASEIFPKFTWWGLVYQFIILVFLFFFYCFDVVDYYKNFLASSLAVAFLYNTNSTTNLIYSDGSKKAAASAGCVLLSMIDLIWIFYFGADNGSPSNRWIDSFSLSGTRPSIVEQSTLQASSYPYKDNDINNRAPYNSVPSNDDVGSYNNGFARSGTNSRHNNRNYISRPQSTMNNSQKQIYPSGHYVSSTALNGLETVDLHSKQNTNSQNYTTGSNTGENTNPHSQSGLNAHTIIEEGNDHDSNVQNDNPTDKNQKNRKENEIQEPLNNTLTRLNKYNPTSPNTNNNNGPINTRTNKAKSYVTDSTMSDSLGLYSDMGDEFAQFPYKARALYSYEADESDAYEISFEQGEILKVGDIEGRWWKAKRLNGSTGIIPSNYVELIQE